MKTKETRNFKIEIERSEDGEVKLRGTAIRYDQRSEVLLFSDEVRESFRAALAGTPIVYGKQSEYMGFYEYVEEGAARAALQRSDVRLLYGHNSDSLLPMGRQSAGTLRLDETKSGVEIEGDPPKKNPFVDALTESIERGDIGEMSFGFTVKKDEWSDMDTDTPTRRIMEIDEIFDVSYVTFAAYNDTTAAVRSLSGNIQDAATRAQEAEATLQDEKTNFEIDMLKIQRTNGGTKRG